MHRADNSNYFLFIEPDATKKSPLPVQDELTESLERAMAQAVEGTSNYDDLADQKGSFRKGGGYRGFHFVEDGEISSVHDYLLPNGFITNSCSVHYVNYYREALPPSELKKLQDLHAYMEKKYPSSAANEKKQPDL